MTGCIRKCEEISAEMTPLRHFLKFSCGLLSRPSSEPLRSQRIHRVLSTGARLVN